MSLTKVIQGMISAGSITAAAVTMATGKLLGRSTAGTGAIEEITIGTGLSLTGGTLSATGGGVSSFNTRTGNITLTTADVNNTIVTGNAVGAILTCAAKNYASTDKFVVGSSYATYGGNIYNGGAEQNQAYAISSASGIFDNSGTAITLTGTWKLLEVIETYYKDYDGETDYRRYAPLYRFQRIA